MFKNMLPLFIKRYSEEIKHWKMFQGILENSFDGLLTTGSDQKIDYCCPSTCRLLGLTESQLLHGDFTSLLHSDEMHAHEEQVARLMQGTRENRQADYVNMASHELKNPIMALMGYMKVLKMRLKDTGEDVRKVFKRIDVQIEKMQYIIGTMLDNTKLQAGGVYYAHEKFELNECIRESADAILIMNDSHRINCTFESPERYLTGDKEKIGRVVTNFLSNAIKYSPGEKNVELETTLSADGIRIAVSDHGIGIAREKQAHLFERFYRVDTLPHHLPGLGLGLYISAEIIKGHQGSLGVASDEGKGSTFWFTLPFNP